MTDLSAPPRPQRRQADIRIGRDTFGVLLEITRDGETQLLIATLCPARRHRLDFTQVDFMALAEVLHWPDGRTFAQYLIDETLTTGEPV